MNVLILTGRFGMGHLFAAQALQEQLQQDGHQADIVDLFEYALPDAAPAMYRAFNLLVTFGGAFYNLYHVITANNSGGNRGNKLLKGLNSLLDEHRPDVVVSTHPVCSAAVSRYKEEALSDLPLVTCVTDVTDHSEWHQLLSGGQRGGPRRPDRQGSGAGYRGGIRHPCERALPPRPQG